MPLHRTILDQHVFPWSLAGLEASCASTINTAKAVVEEAGPAVSQSLHDLASRSVNHSEDSFHKVVTEYGLSLEVPLTSVEADE